MAIHVAMVQKYGSTGLGVRDQALIESALHRPLATFDGELLHRTPFARTAALWLGLLKNHGFVDGNKRTSSLAAMIWLRREGYELRASDQEVAEAAVAIANDRHTIESLATWIEIRAEVRNRRSPRNMDS